jgi:sulfite exporter TauE/SafE
MAPDIVPMLLAALAAGFVGSGHCLLMCGGIAGALGLSSRAAAERQGRALAFPVAYNAGRVASYTIAGGLVGGFGGALAALDGAGHLRLALQLTAAGLLLMFGLALVAGSSGRLAVIEGAGFAVWRRVSPALRHVLPIRSLPRAFAAGMVWGWLPCAMAYGALMVAWMTAGAVSGALLMLAFGLGTTPALVLGAGATERLGRLLAHPATRLVVGAAIAALGALTLASPWIDGHPALPAAWEFLKGCVPPFGRVG